MDPLASKMNPPICITDLCAEKQLRLEFGPLPCLSSRYLIWINHVSVSCVAVGLCAPGYVESPAGSGACVACAGDTFKERPGNAANPPNECAPCPGGTAIPDGETGKDSVDDCGASSSRCSNQNRRFWCRGSTLNKNAEEHKIEQGFSHRQGGVRFFNAGVKILRHGHQI